jgi:hypothetical protein
MYIGSAKKTLKTLPKREPNHEKSRFGTPGATWERPGGLPSKSDGAILSKMGVQNDLRNGIGLTKSRPRDSFNTKIVSQTLDVGKKEILARRH